MKYINLTEESAKVIERVLTNSRECDAVNHALSLIRNALAAQQPVKQEPVAFKFVRYVDGKEMAEGVTIEREKTLDAAIKKAVALCPNRDKTVLVYAAPVRTKDLTDDEIGNLICQNSYMEDSYTHALTFARDVIAAYKEKNNVK